MRIGPNYLHGEPQFRRFRLPFLAPIELYCLRHQHGAFVKSQTKHTLAQHPTKAHTWLILTRVALECDTL